MPSGERSSAWLYAALAVIAVSVWWTWVAQADLVTARKGVSAVGWVYKTTSPGDFARDFPNITDDYGRSAFMWVYQAAYRVGVAPEALLPAVVAFELAVFALAMWVLCRVLLPGAPRVVPWLVVVFAIASPIRDVNLANFPQPYFTGQYYNVAEALRILGLVMFLIGRPIAGAALLAGTFATHPTLGLLGLACAGAMLLTRPRALFQPRHVAAGALFIAIAGGWLLLAFGSVTLSGGEIPVRTWLDLTRAFNYHWYPIDAGLFDTATRDAVTAGGKWALLPFLAFVLMFAYYWPRRDPRGAGSVASTSQWAPADRGVSQRALAAVVSTLVLTVTGLVISAYVPVPALIKLALHRASELTLILGLPYVAGGLWADLRSARWPRAAVALIILVSFCRITLSRTWDTLAPAIPLLWWTVFPLALAAPSWWRVARRRAASTADWTVTLLGVVIAGLGLVYFADGVGPGIKLLVGGGRALLLLMGLVFIAAVTALTNARTALLRAALAAVAVLVLLGLKERADAQVVTASVAGDYLKAQLWARDHTPRHALFMPPPNIYYGWRDYSRRSSFGNLREWLHMSWLYNSNVVVYQEGLRRFNEFGVDLEQYIRATPPLSAMPRLTSAVTNRYYDAPDAWRMRLADEYGIDYFVFERSGIRGGSRLPVVYENDHIIIRAATPAAAAHAPGGSSDPERAATKGQR